MALVAFLSCASQGARPSRSPPGQSWAAVEKSRGIRPGGAWGCGRWWWGGRTSSAEHTLGGLPLFRFSPAAGATSDVEAAVSASAAPFLFLLPLGRPRPRFAGGGATPKGGTRRFVSTRTRYRSLQSKYERTRQRGPTCVRVARQLSPLSELIGLLVIVVGLVGRRVRHDGWEKRVGMGIVEGRGRVITNILP